MFHPAPDKHRSRLHLDVLRYIVITNKRKEFLVDYAMNRPWWAMMNDQGGPQGRPGPSARRGGRGGHGPRPDDAEDGTYGPGAFFGPRGPFGPQGPFGPHGPFGPQGPFGPGGHGRHGGGRARRGDVRQAILVLLAEQPMNGYQIIQELQERTSGAWRPSPGAVYPALSQLQDEGLVEPAEGPTKGFMLTEAGREAASGITVKPWEAIRDGADARAPQGAKALWEEFGQLGLALRAVLATGDADLGEQALRQVKDARKRLYGLLSEPDADADA